MPLHDVGASRPRPGGSRANLEVERRAIARERGPRGARIVRAHELHPFAAIARVHPQARSGAPAPPARRSPPHGDEAPVRTPRGFPGPQPLILEHGARVRPVRIHQPQVALTPAVRDEGDRRPIGREARVIVDGHAAVLGKDRRLSPRDGESVDVAQQVEHEPLAARLEVDGNPRPLVRREIDLAGLATRRGHVPIGGRAGFLGKRGGSRRCRAEDEEGQRQQAGDGRTHGATSGRGVNHEVVRRSSRVASRIRLASSSIEQRVASTNGMSSLSNRA